MSSSTLPAALQNPDPAATYQAAYDALSKAYWGASDLSNKDMIHSAQEGIHDIITALNEQKLASNTELFIQLNPKIKAVNVALQKIKEEIAQITKNINTASAVTSAITKVLSCWP